MQILRTKTCTILQRNLCRLFCTGRHCEFWHTLGPLWGAKGLWRDCVWVLGERALKPSGLLSHLTLSWHCSEIVVMRGRVSLRILKQKQRNFIGCILLMDKWLSIRCFISYFLIGFAEGVWPPFALSCRSLQTGHCLQSLHTPLCALSSGKQGAAPPTNLCPVREVTSEREKSNPKWALCTSLDNYDQALCMEGFYQSE